MFDTKWIRENPNEFDSALARRGAGAASAAVIALDDDRRAHIQKLQEAQTRRNSASKEIGKAMASGEKGLAEKLKKEVSELKGFIQSGADIERDINDRLTTLLSGIPNLPLEETPDGTGEEDNVVARVVGDQPNFDFEPKQHFELGEALGMMDFETAAGMSGARFVILTGKLARLERAIGQFMLDLQTEENGYIEVNPPLLVRDEAMYGTGQLPKFAEDLFATTDGRWLIPTAEVPLTNACQNCFAVCPGPHIAPRPVMTTRCCISSYLCPVAEFCQY